MRRCRTQAHENRIPGVVGPGRPSMCVGFGSRSTGILPVSSLAQTPAFASWCGCMGKMPMPRRCMIPHDGLSPGRVFVAVPA